MTSKQHNQNLKTQKYKRKNNRLLAKNYYITSSFSTLYRFSIPIQPHLVDCFSEAHYIQLCLGSDLPAHSNGNFQLRVKLFSLSSDSHKT